MPTPVPSSPNLRALVVALPLCLLAPAAALASGAKAAEPAPAEAASVAKVETPDPMTRLRERLAQKLGAIQAPDAVGTHELRVAPREAPAAPGPRAAGSVRAKGDGHGHPRSSWSYAGEAGPEQWGKLKPEFELCGSGTRQSPIDIREGIAVDLEPIRFDYRGGSFKVIDNGHTVQVDVAPGSSIEVTGRRYELQQFHFHRPSEERIDGRQFDMSVHFVHKDPDGRLAVVAVLLERGNPLPVLQQVWNNLPLEKNAPVPGIGEIDPAGLLPQDQRYFTYMGSLTTPPCSEGVLWMVMQKPVPASTQQVDIFSRLYPLNARPLQQASGRLIKQSN